MNKQTIQRYRNRLITCGTGVILFGLLNVLETISLCFYGSFVLEETDLPKEVLIAIIIIVVAVLSAVTLSFRFYIGLRAIREGQGKKVRHRYLFVCHLCIISELTGLIFVCIFPHASGDAGILSYIQTFLSAVTSIFIFVQILYSSHFLRKNDPQHLTPNT